MNPELENDYKARCKGESGSHRDIMEHLPRLASLGEHHKTVVEFGVRTGNSTCAFLYGMERGNGGTLYSYDIAETSYKAPKLSKSIWNFTQTDTAKLEGIPVCDVLFIDTLHTCSQVMAELKHCSSVNWYIVLHDTVTFGDKGEQDQLGITHAIYGFLALRPDWGVFMHHPENNGLLILERRNHQR